MWYTILLNGRDGAGGVPVEWDTALGEFPGVGEVRARALERLGLRTAGDLLRYFPRDYEDRTRTCTIAGAPEGESVCVPAVVAETPRLSRIRKGLDLTKVKVVDDHAAMTVTFFNQSYVKDALRPGESYIFYGSVEGLGRTRPKRHIRGGISLHAGDAHQAGNRFYQGLLHGGIVKIGVDPVVIHHVPSCFVLVSSESSPRYL